jgi:error-prone DNA polymerase
MGLELPEEETGPEETGVSWAEGSGLPEFTDAELVRAELEVLGLDASRHVVDFYRPFLSAIGRGPGGGDARLPERRGGAGRRGEGGDPDAADPVRTAGGLRDPGRRDGLHRLDLLRGRTGPLRRDGLPLLAAGHPRGAAPHRPARGVAAGDRGVGAAGAARGVGGRRARRRPRADGRAGGVHRAGDRRGGGSRNSRPVMVRPVLVHPTGFRMSPYADIKPAGDDSKAAARRAASAPPRKLWHSSPGASSGALEPGRLPRSRRGRRRCRSPGPGRGKQECAVATEPSEEPAVEYEDSSIASPSERA